MSEKTKVIMIGPFPTNDVHGGISSVISTYIASDMFKMENFKYIATSYYNRNILTKIIAMILSSCKLLICLVCMNIKIIHIHTASWLSFYRKTIYVFLGKIFKKKIILHIHGGEFDIFYNWGPKINQWIITKILDSVDIILVLSTHWYEYLKKITKNKNIKIIYNPVNTSIFANQIKITDMNKKENVIFMGSLIKRKGIYDLLMAIPLIINKAPSVQFTICGNGEVNKCQRICEEEGISGHVRFCGWVNEQEKINCICNSDVFVLPSYKEGFPVSILEAMSAGLPVVSTYVGGIPDIIQDGINGFLIKPGDIEGIADRVSRLLKEKSLREKIGRENAIKAQKFFDVNVAVNKLSQIYSEILEVG